MCFDHHARPPIAPIAGGATDARDLTLPSADGTTLMAYVALDNEGVEHATYSYAKAPHSFFDRQQEQFAEASADSWEKIKAFIAKHT